MNVFGFGLVHLLWSTRKVRYALLGFVALLATGSLLILLEPRDGGRLDFGGLAYDADGGCTANFTYYTPHRLKGFCILSYECVDAADRELGGPVSAGFSTIIHSPSEVALSVRRPSASEWRLKAELIPTNTPVRAVFKKLSYMWRRKRLVAWDNIPYAYDYLAPAYSSMITNPPPPPLF